MVVVALHWESVKALDSVVKFGIGRIGSNEKNRVADNQIRDRKCSNRHPVNREVPFKAKLGSRQKGNLCLTALLD